MQFELAMQPRCHDAVTAEADTFTCSITDNANTCCRRCQNDPCAGILLTQPKTLQNVANARFAPNCGGSIKIGSLGQKRIGANTLVGQ